MDQVARVEANDLWLKARSKDKALRNMIGQVF